VCNLGSDEQISWPTAVRTAPDLACAIADGYSVNPRIDGKENVFERLCIDLVGLP
jgi:hypothetical protein